MTNVHQKDELSFILYPVLLKLWVKDSGVHPQNTQTQTLFILHVLKMIGIRFKKKKAF